MYMSVVFLSTTIKAKKLQINKKPIRKTTVTNQSNRNTKEICPKIMMANDDLRYGGKL